MFRERESKKPSPQALLRGSSSPEGAGSPIDGISALALGERVASVASRVRGHFLRLSIFCAAGILSECASSPSESASCAVARPKLKEWPGTCFEAGERARNFVANVASRTGSSIFIA